MQELLNERSAIQTDFARQHDFENDLVEEIELVEEIFLQQKNYLAIKHDEKKNGCRKIKSKKIKDKCCEKYVKKGKNCKKCPLTNIIRN